MIEKVINGLEYAIRYGPHYCGGEFGDENEYSRIGQNVLMGALVLLKAQEPKLVTNIHREHNNVLNPNVPWVGKCPKCGKKIEGRNLTRFCKFCGQAVKWE